MIQFVISKLDVQGRTWNTKGEEKLKDDLVGLEIEIHFTEIYKEQPLFSEAILIIEININ